MCDLAFMVTNYCHMNTDSRHYRGTGGFIAESRHIGAIQVFPTVWERCSIANGFGLQCRSFTIAWLWQTPEE